MKPAVSVTCSRRGVGIARISGAWVLEGVWRGAALARVLGLMGMVGLMGLSGCTPALDWREARLGSAGLHAMFPCRPHGQTRAVPLAGARVDLSVHVCEASKWTFAISLADVGEPARVGPALQAMVAATRTNMGAAPGVAATAWRVQGMTPQPASGRWTLQGKLTDGREVQGEVAVFSRGTQVVQATVLGPALESAALQPFFEGLRYAD